MGVNATVGGKRTGEAALCTVYAIAAVPAVNDALVVSMPTLVNSSFTSTPLSTNT